MITTIPVIAPKLDIIDSVGSGVDSSLGNRWCIIFNTGHPACPASERQAKVAHAAEEVKDILVTIQSKQLQSQQIQNQLYSRLHNYIRAQAQKTRST